MNLTKSNLTKLVKDCNANMALNKENIKVTCIEASGKNNKGNYAELLLTVNGTTASNIKIYDNSLVEARIEYLNFVYEVNLDKKVEIEQLISLILPHIIMWEQPLPIRITQSISGWTNAKVVFRPDGKHTCIHTTVVKQAMMKDLVYVSNAKLAKNGNIIIDYKKGHTNFHTGPSNRWWE